MTRRSRALAPPSIALPSVARAQVAAAALYVVYAALSTAGEALLCGAGLGDERAVREAAAALGVPRAAVAWALVFVGGLCGAAALRIALAQHAHELVRGRG